MIEVTIWAARWDAKNSTSGMKFFRSKEAGQNYLIEVLRWAEKFDLTITTELSTVEAEVE